MLMLGAAFLWAPQIRDGVAAALIGAEDAAYALIPRTVLVERLKAAEREATRTRYQAIAYETVATELDRLRFEVGARPDGAFVTARVVARPPRTHYDTLLIAVGSESGIREGDLVSVERILLGTVTSVSARSATVTLLSAPGSMRDASLADPSAIIVLVGQGGGSFETVIPLSVTLAPGDPVVDAETGMVIAFVAGTAAAPTDTAQTVRLAAPVALSALAHVSVTHP